MTARSDQLVHPLARQVMARAEEVHGQVVEASAPPEHFDYMRARDRAVEELDQLLWLLERSTVEQKARDQARWSVGRQPGERCPTCGALPNTDCGAFPHQVADEQGEADYRPCGCNPDEHDHIGACVRRAGHRGPCVAADPTAGPPQIAVFACRPDDAVPHPVG